MNIKPKDAKNRESYACKRAGELTKGKSRDEMSQKEAFVISNKEYIGWSKKKK